MARLFTGSAGTSDYDATIAKFNEVDSLLDADGTRRMVPFSYTDAADFSQKVDISVAGVIMDCGECHVGGGAMEFVPAPTMAGRTPLRDITTADVNSNGPIVAGDYTAFNYFIDTYDVDGDGDESEIQYMDYANTGVMEMDCLLCHMNGYDYLKRTELLRDAKIDATRAVAAGMATETTATWPDGGNAPAGYGTEVIYDNSQFIVTTAGNLRLSDAWFHDNMVETPDSVNCAFCHFNKPAVDWKKRGDNWAPDGQYDFTYEVHYNIGCMGCHQRQGSDLQPNPDAFISRGGSAHFPQMGTGLLGHDPAKGSAPFSSLYNGNDFAAFKTCKDCHVTGMYQHPAGGLIGEAYGAPNPEVAHAAAGLSANIVQAVGTVDGTASISHIDMMACSTCHSRKIDSFDWNGQGTGNNGNPMVDATGNDHEGRLADHENDYIIKEDMTDSSGLSWYKGQLIRASYLNTLFWRDKNDFPASLGGIDANKDGKPNGMDALLMTQVNKVNEANNWTSITEDNHGQVTSTMINERVAALTAEVQSWTGEGTPAIKLSMMHVAFKDQHGVSPAPLAFGAGGCTDCHDAAAEFYNGSINTVGDGVTMFWDNDVTPFTKVNGFTQPTDMHPNVKDKFGVRSLAMRMSTTPYDADGNGSFDDGTFTTSEVPRAATAYEADFMAKADFAASYSSTAAIGFGGFEKGWFLRVQVQTVADGSTIERTRMVSGNVTDLTGLLGNLAAGAADFTNAFEFTIVSNGAGGITIASKDPATHLIRLTGSGSAGAFQLANAAWKDIQWTGTDGNIYDGRADWVTYLDSIDSSDLPDAGVATISNVPDPVEVGTTVQLVADETVNAGAGAVSYSWICNDTAGEILEGATTDKTFNTVGTWTVTLKVIDAYGNLDQVFQQVNVVPPAPLADIALVTPVQPAGSVNSVRFSNLPTHTMLYIIWGDGRKERVYDTAASIDVDHTFRMYSKYFDGTNYNYRTTVYVYNGSSRVDVKRETLTIAP